MGHTSLQCQFKEVFNGKWKQNKEAHVVETGGSHLDIHCPCYSRRAFWCLWTMLLPQTVLIPKDMWMSVVSAAMGGQALVHGYTVPGGQVDIHSLYLCCG